MADAWPFGDLPREAFDLVVADPAWNYKTWDPEQLGRSPRSHYRCMSIEEIAQLPVGDLAAPSAVLVLWTTWPFLPQALMVLSHWGFRYSTGLPWVKLGANGQPIGGTGWRVQGFSEVLLIGIKGRPKTTKAYRGLVEVAQGVGLAERREHSRKPDEVLAWAEGLVRATHAVELFSRSGREGWHAWGDEVGAFEASRLE